MDTLKALYQVYESSEQITFDDSSRIVLMSDCHRGDGSWADNFSRNRNLYITALNHYYNKDYMYIELGDGDELWENRNLSDIVSVYSDVFELLSRFYKRSRLYFIYGNHDMVKKNTRFVRKNFYRYFNENEKRNISLFENIKVHEGLILRHKVTDLEIFLIHGHQVDFLNGRMWMLSRFLVRYLWRPLEAFGVKNPTSTPTNYEKKESIDKRLIEWVESENQMLVAGHTHRPVFPEPGKPPYFNDGSCVHPRYITAIEIAGGFITLVKWITKVKSDGTLYVGREVAAGPKKLTDYFKRHLVKNGNSINSALQLFN
jgi:UDP-2,3-diacylglucosamine pyrophosphatase LpxH